jgi:hypothetical protein
MARSLKTGDKVAWRSSGGGSVGRVERELTASGKMKGHEVAASDDIPNISCAPRSRARSRPTSAQR